MKLEDAIKTTKFKNNSQKGALNILYSAWWYRSQIAGVLKPYGLTPEQFNVLRILRGKQPDLMCVKDIASRLIEKSSNVPRIIDRLETKKLIRRIRSEEDARQTMIQLTKAGEVILAEASKEVDTKESALISLPEDEASLLNNLLEKMRAK